MTYHQLWGTAMRSSMLQCRWTITSTDSFGRATTMCAGWSRSTTPCLQRPRFNSLIHLSFHGLTTVTAFWLMYRSINSTGCNRFWMWQRDWFSVTVDMAISYNFLRDRLRRLRLATQRGSSSRSASQNWLSRPSQRLSSSFGSDRLRATAQYKLSLYIYIYIYIYIYLLNGFIVSEVKFAGKWIQLISRSVNIMEQPTSQSVSK